MNANDKASPIRLAAICAALTKNYTGGSNQPRPGPSPQPSAWDRIKCRRPSARRVRRYAPSLTGLAEICWSAYY